MVREKEGFRASTKHVKWSDYFALMSPNQRKTFAYSLKGLNGFTFRLGDSGIESLDNDELSEGLRLLILMAISFNCDYLEVSKDGEIWSGIPTYDQSITAHRPVRGISSDLIYLDEGMGIEPVYQKFYTRKIREDD
jgi:hypothetical protein